MTKDCGPCSLCCKVYELEELQKAEGVWCVHARPGAGGCAIHGQHPQTCNAFRCWWLNSPDVPEAWRPDKAGFVIRETGPGLMQVTTDPARPDAWRREPFYSQIKRWSKVIADRKGMVSIRSGSRVTVVFPEADLDIGPVTRKDDQITPGYAMQGQRRVPVVRVLRADGSRAQFTPGRPPLISGPDAPP